MRLRHIHSYVMDNFATVYPHFKDFQQNEKYRAYWDICINTLRDKELVVCIKFCNDLFAIPPVKTFLTYYREDFIKIMGSEKAALDNFIKRSIGAFWGMIFKYVLEYRIQKSVSVSMKDCFMIKSASVYSASTGNIGIDWY